MSDYLDNNGLRYLWTKIKSYISGQLSNKQDKLTGQAGQTVVFDSSGNLVPSSGGSSSASSISFDYSISDFPSDINTVQEALDYLNSKVPVGTKITLLASASWTCPCTGTWTLEMHGGGGGGEARHWQGSAQYGREVDGDPGGGSGSSQNVTLTKGTVYNVVIGSGGQGQQYEDGPISAGGSTSFGSYSVGGGMPGTQGTTGTGNIADGQYGSPDHSQPYGNGGDGGTLRNDAGNGTQGVVILTFLG